ncbi:MAG TPA: CDP-alcohol phosphatidyltransferase family protein [Actinomycetota bacterium]|jgi:cardiolipin synthase|nr:CDP-alcohol phosphatidyltransferase family protein [Actinomycetota bacterium]
MGEDAAPGTDALASGRVLTFPNLLSFARIVMIPVFVWLIVDRDSTFVGLVLFGAVLATDWVDGAIARATGQVSELGKVLDPVADRLAMGSGLVALVIRDAFPLWAALAIVVRDGLILVAGAALLAARHLRLEVRSLGKVATFALMMAIGCIAWGSLGYPFEAAFLACGWTFFAVGIFEYYLATVLYVGDLRRALAGAR